MPPKKKATTKTRAKAAPTKARKKRAPAKRTRKKAAAEPLFSEHTKKEIQIFSLLIFGVCSMLSMYGSLGAVGDVIKKMLTTLFGVGAYILPIVLIVLGCVFLFKSKFDRAASNIVGGIMFSVAFLGLMHTPQENSWAAAQAGEGGGYFGHVIATGFKAGFGATGTNVLLAATIIVSVILIFEISIRDTFQALKDALFYTNYEDDYEDDEEDEISKDELIINKKPAKAKAAEKKIEKEPENKPAPKPLANFKVQKPTPPPKPEISTEPDKPLMQTKTDGEGEGADWIFPSVELLSEDQFLVDQDDSVVNENAEVIQNTCMQFGVDVEMHGATVGPTVMQYTLKPAVGVKLSRITALNNDLALALSAKSIRIEAPIPGKPFVGIEIPVKSRSAVKMRSLFESLEYKKDDDPLKVVLGRDVQGNPVIEHLNKMPHLLVGGQTGAGKSVCINGILTSLLYQHSPAELRMILVDPKRVELASFNNLPHLLTPVITEPEKTISALRWAVSEMNRRYRYLADKRAKDIVEFNGKYPDEKLPYIVIVIDELADLMMVASKEVEALICRLAQMARAVGMHLVIATQRPSVDVITGLIKANVPARIAFTVASNTDSRTILDTSGADKLLGRGDMLYLAGNAGTPIRVQGALIENEEIIKITNEIKLNAEPDFNEDITTNQASPDGIPTDKSSASNGSSDSDSLEQQALEVIWDSGKASASLLQRRLSVGYARAARILDILEENGYIGPANGAKPRDILVTREQFNQDGQDDGEVEDPEAGLVLEKEEGMESEVER